MQASKSSTEARALYCTARALRSSNVRSMLITSPDCYALCLHHRPTGEKMFDLRCASLRLLRCCFLLYIAVLCFLLRNIPMHKAARQRHLLDLLSERGQAAVAELAGAIGVSVDTVRRDLADLERQGLAQKHHGGAVA
ncbi:DeoR family transcriptional regulator, partial [Serratia marcescens]|uniref:DeoR family transcriptional regulator n=1 Tax=Serratia marcescens TaxID=615 RepID=UPI0035A05ED9